MFKHLPDAFKGVKQIGVIGWGSQVYIFVLCLVNMFMVWILLIDLWVRCLRSKANNFKKGFVLLTNNLSSK